MPLQRAYAPMHPEFDRFLFASVGEEAEGAPFAEIAMDISPVPGGGK